MTNLHIFSFSSTWFLHTWICLLNYSYIRCRVIFSFSTFLFYFAENICFVFKGYNNITIYIITRHSYICCVWPAKRPDHLGWNFWEHLWAAEECYRLYKILNFFPRENGRTDWAYIFCGHSWMAGGCYRLKKSKIFFDFHFYFSTGNAGPFS